MQNLREKLLGTSGFVVGVELVSIRSSMAEDDAAGPAEHPVSAPARTATASRHAGLHFFLSKWVHSLAFTPGRALSRWGAALCRRATDPRQGPRPLRAIERLSKSILYRCQDCGDCSLPEVAYLCQESQCATNQRNGPCGGTREGRCEVDGYGDCVWLRAYERLRHDRAERTLLQHAPVVQDQGLRGTSSWANSWLGRDHAAPNSAQAERSPHG